MSNQDLRQPSQEGPQSMNESESSSEGGSWYHRSDEDQDNRPHADPNTQIVYTEFPPGTSPSYDIERPEYGNDPVALRKAFKKAKRRQNDIDAERRSWYGEDADEVMEYQFRFTPDELRDRAAERHGGQTFYEHMVEIGQAQDLDRIVGDELEEELEKNYERRMEEWRSGIHPDSVPDWDQGDDHNQGDDQNDDDDGNRDKDKKRLANSEQATSREYSDSGDRGADEDETDTPSTDRTRAMTDSDSESKSQKRRRLSDDAFDSGRVSKKQGTPEQSDNDEAAAMQVQREFYQSQPEQTEEPSEETDVEHQRQQDERRDLFFKNKELRESLDRRQSGEQQPPQPQLQQQTQQQELEEGEGEDVRPRTRLEYEREARLQHDLEYVLQHQEDIRAHLRGIQRRLDSTGGTEPNLRELWEVQMQNLELQRHREMRIEQRLRVLQQQSRIEDLQYRQNGLSEEIGRIQIEQDQVRERLKRIGQQMRLHGYRADWRREETALEEEQYQLGQQAEHMERRIFALQQQIAEMEADQRVQERRWDELRVQEGELVKAWEQLAEDDQPRQQQQQQQQQQGQQQIPRQPRDQWPSQISQLERENRRQENSLWNRLDRRNQEREQQRRRRPLRELQPGQYPVEGQNPQLSQPVTGPQGPQRPRGQQQRRRPQATNPAQSQNQPLPISRNIIGPRGPSQQQEQQQGRREERRDLAQVQTQLPPPPAWPLRPQQAPQESRQQGDQSTSQDQSQWSDNNPRRRTWSTSSEDDDRRAHRRVRRDDTESDDTGSNYSELDEAPIFAPAREATLALQTVIEESPQQAERATGPASGQGSGEGSRQLLPPAEIQERWSTPRGLQVSTLFTNGRTRSAIRPQGFTGPARASGGAWIVTTEEASNARDNIQEQRRISEQQAAQEQANTRPVIHDDSSESSTPTRTEPPTQQPVRPKLSLPGPPRPLLFPSLSAAQRPQTAAPVEPPINLQPPSFLSAILQSPIYPPAPASTPVHLSVLPRVRSVPQPRPQPADVHAPPQTSTAPAPTPAPESSQAPDSSHSPATATASAPAPAQTFPRRGRGRTQTTARSTIRKSTRVRKQTSRSRESQEQAATARRPKRAQTMRQRATQRQQERQRGRRQRQSQDQTQAQPPTQNQHLSQPPVQNQTTNQNPGQAPEQNSTQPVRRQPRRQSRWTQPYDVSGLRRSTRNRKPPDRYVPSMWIR